MSDRKLDLANIRIDYISEPLNKEEVNPDPFLQFKNWFSEAQVAEVAEVNAMHIATVNSSGRPSARIVLLKGMEDDSFIFYTNYNSRKGKELDSNPWAAITFFWPELARQLRIEGKVNKVSPETSDEYFNSRPFESRLGALASPQSEIIPSRSLLEENFSIANKDYAGKDFVHRPDHWGGYQLKPDYFEYWQGRENRMHDRIAYFQDGENWRIERLAP